MEDTKCPNLKKPKRRLCYLTSEEHEAKHWRTLLKLDDVDKLSDDLDLLPDDELPPSPPLLQTCDVEPAVNELEVSPIPLEGLFEDDPHPAMLLTTRKPHAAESIPFKGHQPVKTSSPINQNMDVESVEKQDKGKVEAASPVCFPLEDEVQEAPLQPSPSEKLLCNSNHGITEAPVVTISQEPKPAAAEQAPKSVVGSNMKAFLQKLKEAGKSKLASSRKSVSPVKAPPPEPEFIISEDDSIFLFSIPTKITSKHRQQSKSDKDSSAAGVKKDMPQETPHRREELEKANRQMEGQTVNQKSKKKIDKVKNDDVASPEFNMDTLLVEQEKPDKKKQQLQKVQSKESHKAESQPEAVNSETEGSSQKTKAQNRKKSTETKARKSAEARKQSSTKDSETNTQTSRTKPPQRPRKELQGSDAEEEMMNANVEEPIATEALSTPTENQYEKSDSIENVKQKESPGVTDGSSAEDCQVLGKRKRRPTGSWWLIDSQRAEEASSLERTVKKSRRSSKKQIVARSPAKGKNGKVSKKGNKTISPKSSRNTIKAKGKKTEWDQRRKSSGGTTKIKKKMFEVSKTPEDEQPEELLLQQQDGVSDPDLDQEQSSPSVSTHRDPSTKSVSEASTQPEEELREVESVKRKRKPSGSWWMVNNNTSSNTSPTPQLQPKKPKPQKQRKKRADRKKSPALSPPGSVDTLSRPAGGAPTPPLKVVPLFTPKNVKRSLAKFTDIFTSNVNTPRVLTVRHTQRDVRQRVASHPAEENAAGDCRRTNTEALGVDEGDGRSPENNLHKQESLQDSTSQHLVSGPASMIESNEDDEADDTSLLSSRLQAQLSVSDLCGPPLKPLTLQPQDKSNMAEWFKTLWVTLAENHTEVTPDQFHWYFYQDKAMGLQEDLNSGPICTGKILLGSDMKKPLWVDHSATTVFNLLSSSVSVAIDGSVSHFGPGQSFMVQCGHAYSIKNTTKQPAILYFTRIFSESSD